MKRVILFLILFLFSFTFISAGELRVTEEHPFLINREWISAFELKVGDELTLVNGSKAEVHHSLIKESLNITFKNLRGIH